MKRTKLPTVMTLATVLFAATTVVTIQALAQPEAIPPSSTATSQDERDIREAHQRLMDAYASTDVDELTGVLADSENLHLFHPRGTLDFESLSAVRWGIQRMWDRVGPAAWLDETHNRIVVEGTVGWHTYHMTMRWEDMGVSIDARGTEIWVKRDDGWKLMHAHWSENDVDYRSDAEDD